MKTLERRMKHPLIAAMLAASALAITAGCESFAPQDYGYGEARTVESVAYGTIESVRPARLNQDHAPVGTIAGAAIGGLLGNTIGHGDGRGIATILGAVGGGFAGNAIEHNASAQNGEEIVVHLDNGSTIAVVQGGTRLRARPARARPIGSPGLSRRARLESSLATQPMAERKSAACGTRFSACAPV